MLKVFVFSFTMMKVIHGFPDQSTLRGGFDVSSSPPKCAAEDPGVFGRNIGRWEQDMFRTPTYNAASCSYMQHKFACGNVRSARINRWSWKQERASSGSCVNTDFGHDSSAEVDAEFFRCTSNKTIVMMGDSNTRNSFVGMLCRFHQFFPPYVYTLSNGAMSDTWMPPPKKKLKPGEAADPLYRDSHYTAFNGLSLHFSSVYFSPEYDFPRAEFKKKTAADIVGLPLDQLLPQKHVDFLIVNIGIHLHNWCDYKMKCIRETYSGPVKQFLKRLVGSGRVGKVLWRMTYPGRAPSSSRAPVKTFMEDGTKIIASIDPFPPSPPITKAVDGSKLVDYWKTNTQGGGDEKDLDGCYMVEYDTMSSPDMRALGVEIIDSAAMLAYRSDAHTEEGRDGSSSAHSCLPGPIDDVNSLMLNRVCYGR